MKLIIIIPDGMADLCYPELDNLSPVEYASTPHLDAVVRRGQVGLAQTMVPGLPLGSLVGIFGLLGYNPADYFPLGRSVFEARALNIPLAANDVAFRCNIVRVNEEGRLADFTAGQISDAAAERYLEKVTPAAPFELHHDLSYRNVLVWRDCPLVLPRLYLAEPHEHVGQPIDRLLPGYEGHVYGPLVSLMQNSQRDGLMLWPWGAGRPTALPQLPYRLTMVTALSFVAGLTYSLGGRAIIPAGATGYRNTDLAAKCAALTDRLDELDVGIIHCNAPDEEAHIQSLSGKIAAIEAIDQLVIGPLLTTLEQRGEPYRLLICPDHYTCCCDGRHRSDPVPFAIYGTGLTPNHSLPGYSETAIYHTASKCIDSSALITLYLEKKL
ncbi:MAG: hypothetical protein KDJ52_03550 [Anaerolineae bacterium]|nr:hypothetical protein [Anaerolineae bacterium]